ncbi:putative esterase [Paraburkholderia sp. MM5482-R2]
MSWQQFEHGWRRAPQNAPATSLVVLMHGVGSNARDLMPLADIWSEELPGTAFVSLDGTDPFDGGFGGRQWFSLRDVGAANREGARRRRLSGAAPRARRRARALAAVFRSACAGRLLARFDHGAASRRVER